MKKMKAFRLLDWQNAQLAEIDVPVPKRGEMLVKVAGNGLCHSDLSLMALPKEYASTMPWSPPFTLGHEIGGWVEELGDDVLGFTKGEPVVLSSTWFCGECDYCISGYTNNCKHNMVGRGFGKDGGLAEYVLVDSLKQVVKLNSLDPVTAGTLTDAGSTAYHAVKRILPKLIPGSTAVIIGAGGLGIFAIQYIRLLSASKIIAVDMNENRLNLAREFGAHETLTGVTDSTTRDILELTNGRGAEAVLDFAGYDNTIETGLAITRKVGIFGLIGSGRGVVKNPLYRSLPLDGEVFCFQGATLSDLREVIQLAENGHIRNDVETFSLDDIHKAYEKLKNGELIGRAVIKP